MAQCEATTKRGSKCLNQALPGQPFCAEHHDYLAQMRTRTGALDTPAASDSDQTAGAQPREDALLGNPLYQYVRARAEAGDDEAIALLAGLRDET